MENYITGYIPPFGKKTSNTATADHCRKCPPYLRGQQAAVTLPQDFCGFNQKGWFYTPKVDQALGKTRAGPLRNGADTVIRILP